MTKRLLAIFAVLVSSMAAGPADEAIHIAGSGAKPSDWGVKQIRQKLAGEIKPVEYNSKGAKRVFDCVPLASVLKAAGVDTDFAMNGAAGPKLKNPQMRMAVMVRGRDGYGAVFSLAELLPMVGHRDVWLALDMDGKPLADADGPTRLIVPDDQMPARGVHQVASIDVIDLSPAATQPAGQ